MTFFSTSFSLPDSLSLLCVCLQCLKAPKDEEVRPRLYITNVHSSSTAPRILPEQSKETTEFLE